MISFPADERTISEVERGKCRTATLPLPPGETLAPGDSILFALASGRNGAAPSYVKGGDSVVVLLTQVVDLDRADPGTGHPLMQLDWTAPGAADPPGPPSKRPGRAARPRIPA